MRRLPILAATALAATALAQSPLTTTFTGTNQGNVGGAIFFDLQVNQTVTFTQFDINCGTGAPVGTPGTLQVWMGPTTYVGNTSNPGAWTQVSSGTLTTNARGTPTPVPLTPFALGPGHYGIALIAQGFNHGYTTGALTASTTELTLTAGAAQNVPWSATLFSPRSVNISINYTLGGNPVQVAVQEPFGQGCYSYHRTFYEFFPNTALGFDLSNNSMLLNLSPTTGGYDVVQGSTNWFTPATPDLGLGSDGVQVVQVPFPILYPDQGTILTTLQLEISANGFVSPTSNASSAASPTVTGFLTGAARWANWYNFDPAAGGSVHWDVDIANGAAYATWLGVRSQQANATDSSTFQIAFFTNGSVEFRWQAMSLTYGGVAPTLVGWTPGNNALDPGNRDLLSQGVIQAFSTQNTDNPPLALAVSARPLVGTSFSWDTSDIPTGTVLGALLVGFQRFVPGINLSMVGAPDCFQNVNYSVTSIFVATGPTQSTIWAIPNNAGLNGISLNGQSATFSAGFNPLGIITSNGVHLVIGSL
ncbi:MAG: hypothetical protein Fur0037_15130 [Planctomycetota bacterium]